MDAVAVAGEEGDLRFDALGEHLAGQGAQIAEDQVAAAGHGQEVRGRGLIVAREARKGDVRGGAVFQVADPLDFQGSVVVAMLVARGGEELGQVLGECFHGAVLDYDARKRAAGWAGGNGARELAQQSGDDPGQKGFDRWGEALTEALLGGGGVGGQTGDAGDGFQGAAGFRSHRQEPLKELEDRDFAGGALQKAGLAREAFDVELLEFGEGSGALLLEGGEACGRILPGEVGLDVFGKDIVYILYEATTKNDRLPDQGAEGGATHQPFLLCELARSPRGGDGDYEGRGDAVVS